MPDADDIARIRAYLREHGATYERDALRTRLIADGHSPETVDLAIAQEYGFAVTGAAPPPDTRNRGRIILVAIGVFLVNFVVLPLVIGLLAQQVNAAAFGNFLIGSIGLVVLALAVESVAAVITRRRDPVLSRGLTWGVLLTLLPIVGGVLLVGVCIIALTRMG